MNLEMFYEKQEYLEKFVRDNIGMSEEEFSSVEMVDKRVFAFKVELGEFSNEVGWFKYWKQSHVVHYDKVIEELADCIHFLLAIGLYRKYQPFIKELDWEFWMDKDSKNMYHDTMTNPIASSGQWRVAFEQLIAIGVKLGFSIEHITLAYLLKNQKNIERQLNNY